MHDLPDQRAGQGQQLGRNVVTGPHRIEAPQALGQHGAVTSGGVEQLDQTRHLGVICFAPLRPSGGVSVINAPQRMQEVTDVPGMGDHPGRVFAADDDVIAGHVEL